MRVVIVGPGAMGCLFASLFSKKKQAEVWLLDNDSKRAKKISDQGIIVEGLGQSFNQKVNITSQIKDIPPSDLVILCVKSYDTEGAIKQIEPLLAEDTNVLTLQNGLGNIEMIAEIVGKDRVLGGVTSNGATLLGDGHIRFGGQGETVIGKIDGRLTVPMRGIREIFNKSGFSTRLSKDINGIIWSKLILNVGINALSALTRLTNGQLLESPGTREILSQVVTEAVKIAKKKRIKLIYDDPIQKVESVCKATANNLSSMLQDILNRKITEIDWINGAIVRQGKSLGIATPANLILTDLIKAIESAYRPKP
ncbi:MAG: 2-dehydropantoate 2-reductase [Candidatus Omnitrophica bacterium]|nr:2-dehydropantoate 2-reductase [Candidatus Omnitrophota bacterium]